MGNHPDSAPALAFLQRFEDSRFGEVDIFRSEQGRFVMRLARTHVVGEARHCLFKRVNEWLQQEQQFVVPVMYVSSQLQKGLCIQVEESEVFTEYYNFTLLDLVRSRKELELAELWLLCQALLSLTRSLRSQKLAISLKADNVFLTLKGLPCVYSHHFLSFEESVVYSDYSMGQQVALVILQLALGQQVRISDYESHNHLLPLVAKVCARNKQLGALVKQLLNREKNEEEALRDIETLLQNGEISKATEIKLNKFRYALPEESAQKGAVRKGSSPKKGPSNAPVEFKPRKPSKTEIVRDNRTEIAQDSKPCSSECKPAKQVLGQTMPDRQSTSQLFCELARRKEQARRKMAKVQQRKQQLLGKENRDQPGKNRQR